MRFSTLDNVVLVRDLPGHGLLKGDLRAVVEVSTPPADSRSSSSRLPLVRKHCCLERSRMFVKLAIRT